MAIERALNKEHWLISCLQSITSCNGAMTGLHAVVLENHINKLIGADGSKAPANSASKQLIDIVYKYFA